jgi:ligand-binding sensor domain-containing protein
MNKRLTFTSILFILFISLFTSFNLFGQTWEYYFNNDVSSFNIDSKGNKWLGTENNGIKKFDGTNWTYYSPATIGGIDSAFRISCIAFDKQGDKWFAAGGALFKFDGTNWKRYQTPLLKYDFVTGLVIDSQGNKWISSYKGVFKFDGINWTRYTTDNGLATNGIYCISIDSVGDIFVGTSVGLSKFDGTIWKNYSKLYANNYIIIVSIAIDSLNNKWITTDDGVYKFDGINFTKYVNTPYPISFNNIMIDKKGRKFVRSNSGWLELEGTTSKIIYYGEGVVSFDPNGDLWVVTSTTIDKLTGADLTRYDYWFSSTSINPINSISIDEQGNKWLVSGYGYLSKFNGKNWTNYVKYNNSNYVQGFLDANNNKFLMTYGDSILKFDGNKFVPLATKKRDQNVNTRFLTIDAQNNLWVGTDIDLSKFDGINWTSYTTATGLPNNNLTCVALDTQGNKWFGTRGGISKYNGTNWINYTTSNGLIKNDVTCITIDSQGNKWIGTSSGVSKFDGTNWTNYTTTDGLINNNVLCISIDILGNKWIGTSGGVSKFDGTNWTNKTKHPDIQNYPYNSYSVNSIANDPKKGTIWFGTTVGLIALDDKPTSTTNDTEKGLIAYYPLDSNATDKSANALNGLDENITYETGIIGRAAKFNGNSRILLSKITKSFSKLSPTALTVSLWAKYAKADLPTTDIATLIRNRTRGYQIMIDKNAINGSAYVYNNIYGFSKSSKSDVWQHIVLTYDYYTLSMYIDGELIDKKDVFGSIGYNLDDGVVLGRDGSANGFYKGLIDEVRIYDRGLSAEEVKTLYSVGSTCVSSDLSILNLEPSINQTRGYTIMEGATVHHYFQIKNSQGNPIIGAQINYSLSSVSGKIFTSPPSTSLGIVDLNINLSGADKNNLSDDLLRAGQSSNVKFESIGCAKTIMRNDFVTFPIVVSKFEGNSLKKGIYLKGNVDVGVCAGCIGEGPFGASALSLSVGKGLGFDLSWSDNNTGGVDWSIETSSSAGVKLSTGEASEAVVKFEGPTTGITMDNKLKFTNLKALTSRDYLVMLYLISKQNIFEGSVAMNVVSLGLRHYLGTKLFTTNFDYSDASSVAFNAGIGGFSINKKSKSNISSPLSFTVGAIDAKFGFEMGTDYKSADKSFDDYVQLFYGFDLTPLKIDLKLTEDTKLDLFDSEFSLARQLRWDYVTVNEALKNGAFTISQQGSATIGSVQTVNGEISVDKEYALGENAIKRLKTAILTEGLKSETAKILTKIGGAINPTGTNLTPSSIKDFGDMETHIASKYDPTWKIDELKITDTRKYTVGTDISLDLPLTEALVLGLKQEIGLSIGAYSQISYPLSEKFYHAGAQDYLKTIEYPTSNKFINVPPDAFTVLWQKIKKAFAEFGPSVWEISKDAVKGYFKSLKNTVVEESISFVNWARSWSPFLRSPKPDNLQVRTVDDFSKLSFIVPASGKAFAINTDIVFSFYYPAGEVKGILPNKDTFAIVSDIFFFTAVFKGDTLKQAPNGNFSINAYIGKDDLDFFGYDQNSTVSLMYKTFDSTIWQNLGPLSRNQNNLNFSSNKTGIYALGKILSHGDLIPPTIKITLPSNVKKGQILTADISDIGTGVDWQTVTVSLNGKNIPFTRTGFTSALKISVDSFPTPFATDSWLIITGRDMAGNLASSVSTISQITATDDIETHKFLLKVFPNPTQDEINIYYSGDNAGKVNFIISDVAGREVMKISEKSSIGVQQEKINISSLHSGIYILNIVQDNKILDSRKLIKL